MERKINNPIDFYFQIADKNSNINISNFCCGIQYLDKLLQNIDNESSIWLVLNDVSLIGYLSIASSGLIHKTGDNSLIVHPAIKIKAFAIDKRYQDYFFINNDNEVCLLACEILSYFIFCILPDIISHCYASFLILDSVPNAVGFYQNIGFKIYSDFMLSENLIENQGCIPMYMNII